MFATQNNSTMKLAPAFADTTLSSVQLMVKEKKRKGRERYGTGTVNGAARLLKINLHCLLGSSPMHVAGLAVLLTLVACPFHPIIIPTSFHSSLFSISSSYFPRG